MTSIQILSDLHLESPKAYDLFDIVPKAPYLALLGDIGKIVPHREECLGFLTRQLRRFRAVLFVPGNHEAYGATWTATLDVLREFEADIAVRREADSDGGSSLGQFVVLDRGVLKLPVDGGSDILVLGCSLFSHVPPHRAMAVEMGLQDFFQTKSWDTQAHNAAHQRDLAWLNRQILQLDHDGSNQTKVVILTHWSPTVDARASDPKHRDSAISSGFASDLPEEVCFRSANVVLWAFGHTHYNCDFMMERNEAAPLRVMTNQRGYYFAQAGGFDGEKVARVE